MYMYLLVNWYGILGTLVVKDSVGLGGFEDIDFAMSAVQNDRYCLRYLVAFFN